MTSTPKATNKRRQNPWYKAQVGSLNGRHARLADKVRALKAYANSTEVALRDTQQELAFTMGAIREIADRLKTIEAKIDDWISSRMPLTPKGDNLVESSVDDSRGL